jgi:hypothetical protein
LGLIALVDVPAEYRIEIKLIAVTKENKGRLKKYDGIAGCLLTYAAREAINKYERLACISLTPKTELRQHYIKKYGMKTAGQQVYAENESLWELIETYDI